MSLGSTQPLVKMNTRNIPGGKGGRCVRLTTSPPSRAKCHEIWEPKPPGTLWATPGLLQDSFTFYIHYTGLKFNNLKIICRFLFACHFWICLSLRSRILNLFLHQSSNCYENEYLIFRCDIPVVFYQ